MTPIKIGFIASLFLHSLLGIALLSRQDNVKISNRQSNTISISLENINNKLSNQQINQQKRYEKPKKQHTEKPKQPNKIAKQEQSPRPIQEEIQDNKQNEREEVAKNFSEETDENPPNNAKDTQDSAVAEAAQELDMNSELYAEILRIINKHNPYPKDAYRRGITGSVEIRFVLRENGEIENIEILNQIHKSLSNGAIEAINNSYKKFPSVDNNIRIKIKLTYNLT